YCVDIPVSAALPGVIDSALRFALAGLRERETQACWSFDMSEPNHPAAGEHGPSFKTYIAVFVALSICTALSFVANWAVSKEIINLGTSVTVILAIAIIKATLV